MPRYKKKPELRFVVTEDIYEILKKIADRRGETMAEVARKIIVRSVSEEAAKDGMDYVAATLRDCLRDSLKPLEDRLAKINAKVAVTSGTSMYMSMQVIEEAGYDSQDIYTKARKKAVALLQEREGDTL
ncbi:hypothetical protein LOK74_02060 [Brevibacillus humidisoli]|uniref:hypothetical protein n=1 Tax=Brevibacillus humidisoli TaxID=2895522 RepID=UPI001E4DA64E|nr:hypothetical protein [Brevibacillus humidisoli]UFJ41345.1 hypothetical protein LOK74_02060 [Brevibacillus humidisoli]